GGEFEWQDEWRGLPPLRLRDVNIRLANDGAYHRVGMRATPAANLASPIELRSEFVGSNVREVSDWDGSADVRVDYADVAALSKYLPLPIEISRGDGGLQAWFELDNGRPVAVTTDLVVRDARVKLGASGRVDSAAAAKPAAKTQLPVAPAAPVLPPPIALTALSGRFSWRETASASANVIAKVAGQSAAVTQRWSLRDVEVTPINGVKLPALSAELTLERVDAAIRGGEFRSANIDLASANSLMYVVSPLLPTSLLEHGYVSQPRGKLGEVVAKWSFAADEKIKFDAAATVSDVSWARGLLPGATGISGKLRATDEAGSFSFEPTIAATNLPSIATKNLLSGVSKKSPDTVAAKAAPKTPVTIDFGDIFSETMHVGAVSGAVKWQRVGFVKMNNGQTQPQWQIASDGLDVNGEHAKGRFAGTWRNDELGPGIAKITGKLDTANTDAVFRYLPRGVGENARNWVKNAIVGGRTTGATFALEGPLWHFPFVDGKQGKFEIVAPVTGVTVDYADRWPRAENVDALLTFNGSSFNAAVSRATIAGAAISATQVKIADMSTPAAVVEIRGTAVSSLDNFLRFVATSPVSQMIDRFTETAKGSGASKLALGLAIPIAQPEKTKVDGEFVFEGNRIELGGDVPTLDAVTGRIRFSEKDMSAKELRATAFGGNTAIDVLTDQSGVIRASASGRTELARVRETYDYPLLDQLKGSIDWKMETQSASSRDANSLPTVRVSGVLSPQALPFDRVYQAAATPRDATQPIAFSLVRSALAQGRDRIEFEMPAQLHAIIERSAEKPRESRVVERAVVDFGAQKTALPTRGYSLRGELAKLDTDAALALVPALTGKNSKNVGGVKSETTTPDFINVNLKVDRALVFSHVLSDVSLRAQPSGQRWRLALRSKEALGVISVENDTESNNIDAVSVRLQRFALPTPMTDADRLSPPVANAANATNADASTRWPKLDLVADTFVSDGRDLGKLEIAAQPSANEWRIDRVKLTSADGALNAKGRWRLPSGTPLSGNGQTSVEVSLDWKDAGRFMQRFGLPKGVERGEGDLKGEISWAGSPAQFGYNKLDGKFALQTKAGRFSEMEPGIAKLLGVISLQSLPRRLSFNFDDLFGRGFAFDSISAEVAIAKGKANTDGFSIVGPAARVEIRGDADLDAETTQLRVRVFPSVSVATAIGVGLATANPAIGAAAWLGQKIARDPVERLLMQEFEVSGAWANPEVKQTRGMGATNPEDKGFDSTGQAISPSEPVRR
ncbi:MAG: YhdP family protein, partial [Casimicrobium sp.]